MPHPNPQYVGIPAWLAVQALGETKARDAIAEDRLTLGRTETGEAGIGILTHCPRCKRAFEEE